MQHDAWETVQRGARRRQRVLRRRVQPDRPRAAGRQAPGSSSGARASWRERAARSWRGRPPRSEEILLVPVDLGAGRLDAHPLALPARPPDRRLRRPDEALPRLATHGRCPPRPRRRPRSASGCPPSGSAQEAVWLSWPHRLATWPGNFRPIPAKFAEIAARISLREKVRDQRRQRSLAPRARRLIERAGADMANVEFFNHPTNDAWCRDHGPIFVRNDRTGEVAVTDWDYNAWGGKYPPFDRDDRIPERVGRGPGTAPVQGADGARGGLDRRQRPRAPPDDRGLPPQPEPQPGPRPGRRSRRTCRDYLGVETGPVARATGSRGTTPTATSTT